MPLRLAFERGRGGGGQKSPSISRLSEGGGGGVNWRAVARQQGPSVSHSSEEGVVVGNKAPPSHVQAREGVVAGQQSPSVSRSRAEWWWATSLRPLRLAFKQGRWWWSAVVGNETPQSSC